MKKLIIAFFCITILSSIRAQTSIYLEDFEGVNSTVNSYTASGSSSSQFAINSNYYVSGTKSDSAVVLLSDTVYLETNTIDASSAVNVTLQFQQICKIDFFDKGMIQVSNDNGATWTTLTNSEYNGTGFLNSGAFSSISYTEWNASNGTLLPTSSWWKFESFDISSIAGSSTQVKVRFALIDADNNGARSNYGWLLDDIELIGAGCELIPPTITLTGTVFQGQIYSTGPFNITADIIDASGVASASIQYSLNNGPNNFVPMNLVSGNGYQGVIPSASVGDTICYSITATDNTSCMNVANNPSSGCYQFEIKSNPPPSCVGSPIFTYTYNESFASFLPGNGQNTAGSLMNDWVNETSGDSHDWWVYDQATQTQQSGPSQDHSPLDANYLYVEASNGNDNKMAILNSPCYDFSSLISPKFRFWYHMYGSQMGSLHLDIYSGGQWVLDIMPSISGDQGNQWLFNEVDLTAYSGSIVKLRFRANTGTGFNSDIAIDDIEIFEPLANDISLNAIVSPNPSGCSGSSNEFITVELENNGVYLENEIPLAYRLNGGAIVRDTAKFNISPGGVANHTFQQTINMSSVGNYSFDVWLELNGDLNLSNDSIFNYTVVSSSITDVFPDSTDFDGHSTGIPGILIDGWANSQFDSHDWYVNTGGTLSGQTGPTGDNTSGSGNYIYLEATNLNNLEASLFSKCFDINLLNSPELSFFYHMSGIEMGELHVDIVINGFTIQDIITPISGDQGASWNLMTVDLTPFKGIVKVVLRGITGNGYRSDIAIDDFSIRDAMPLGIQEDIRVSEIVLFPNPTSDYVNILAKDEIQSIQLLDITGKLVFVESIHKNDNKYKVDMSSLNSGIYFIRTKTNSGVLTKKVILN
jgi:hypothetical protein